MDQTYKILKFLADGLVEDKMWFLVSSLQYKAEIKYEVQYTRSENKPWAFRPKHTETWIRCSTIDLIDALNEKLIDLNDFHIQLCDRALSQVTYMDMCIRKAKNILGDSTVNNYIKEHNEFRNNLMNKINEIFGIKSAPPILTLLKRDE